MKPQTQKRTENKIEYPVVLNRYLAVCGIASRRKCAEVIKSGRVSVNSAVVNEPGRKIERGEVVCVDGKPLQCQEFLYIILNKPRGCICTNRDAHAEKTVFDLVGIPGVRLFTVGRLDKDSEGLLILTNDGDFANRVTHPRYEVNKEYLVTLDREFSGKEIEQMIAGITEGGEQLRVMRIRWLGECRYRFVLGEGKKREIRRLVAFFNKRTIRLQRDTIGGLKLGDLKTGHWRFLTDEEKSLCLRSMR